MKDQASSKKYLQLLAKEFPNRSEVVNEVVLLSSVLNLTKGAEIFLSDVHGEHEAFEHVLRNGSGAIKEKIKECYQDELKPAAINQLATIIYYPEEKLSSLKPLDGFSADFYRVLLKRLIKLNREFAKVYSSKKLRKLIPEGLDDLILELVSEREIGEENDYYDNLLQSIIDVGHADQLIIDLSYLIQRLAIHKIHIIGDVYDRGPGAEIIMDRLSEHHAVDLQWGNHDIVWMGAALGSTACMANVLRLSLRYANTDTLEKGYGIHLIPLASFAIEYYREDQGIVFDPKVSPDDLLNASENWLNRLMHKAISIIQFKLEGQLIKRRPEFRQDDRLLLEKIDFDTGNLVIDSERYALQDRFFPTLDPKDPYKLTPEEEEVVKRLQASFNKSFRLQRHAEFLYEKGSMYTVTNGNLLYHGCIPLNPDGSFRKVDLGKGSYKGKALLDYFDQQVKVAYSGAKNSEERNYAIDLIWYLWAGPYSPIFGKDKMATFERYFLNDPALRKETMDHYYSYRDDPTTAKMILEEFGLAKEGTVILNGHVPVSVKKGESPEKANGQLIVIDGGFSKAYQEQTGIAGYTLMHDCYGRQLIAHESFESREHAIASESDIAYSETCLTQSTRKLKVKDLDDSRKIEERIKDLKELLQSYEQGTIKEAF